MLLSARKRQVDDDLTADSAENAEYELLNISKLAFHFDLDRATVRKRIADAGIEPVDVKAKEVTYELTTRLKSILGKVNNQFDEAKLRKETADAELRETKVAVIRGELVPISEVVDDVQRLFGMLHKEIAVRQPKRLMNRVRKAKTAALAERAWKADTDRVFKMLREDYDKLLG